MSEYPAEILPLPLQTVRSRPLFTLRLDVRPLQLIGGPEGAFRRVGVVPGGRFEGERLSGEVLEGASDWQIVRGTENTRLDVRLVLKTSDGALIGMTYQGLRNGPADVIARVEQGEPVDPATYYFRIAPLFETGDTRYAWINRLIAIGIGARSASGPLYAIHEIL